MTRPDFTDLIEQLAAARDDLAAGYWMHAKGGIYVVNQAAVCSETHELRVMYSKVNEQGFTSPDSPSWDRPYSMWHEEVEAPSGVVVPRFERIRSRHDASQPAIIEEMRVLRGA